MYHQLQELEIFFEHLEKPVAFSKILVYNIMSLIISD